MLQREVGLIGQNGAGLQYGNAEEEEKLLSSGRFL